MFTILLSLWLYFFIGFVLTSIGYIVNGVLEGRVDDYWLVRDDDWTHMGPIFMCTWPLFIVFLSASIFFFVWKKQMEKWVELIKKVVEK